MKRGFMIATLLLLPALSACEAGFPGRLGRPRSADPRTIPYSAYRPAHAPGPPRRTFAIGNYAGYRYPEPLLPTLFKNPGRGRFSGARHGH